MNTAISINNVNIRLTDERWLHITLGHPELADYYYEILDTVENPAVLYEGDNNGVVALKITAKTKGLVVIYKEIDTKDGYIITAYLTNKFQKFNKKRILWEQKK